MLAAGKLVYKIRIEAPSAERDSFGQPVVGWTTVADTWADIRFGSGAEAIKAGAEISVTRASIRIRARSDITPAMRIVQGGTVYQLKAVPPGIPGRDYMDLVAEVVT